MNPAGGVRAAREICNLRKSMELLCKGCVFEGKKVCPDYNNKKLDIKK